MTPGTVKIINKNLLKQRNDKQKLLNEKDRQLRKVKNENKVYKEYADGKISRADVKQVIDKSERAEAEMTQIKLRKVRVERIRNEQNPFDHGHEDENKVPKSMASLMALFNTSDEERKRREAEPKFLTQKTVVEEGNVAPGKAFRPSQHRRMTKDGEELASDSSVDEDEVIDEADPEEEKEEAAAGPQQSFIQLLFDSQVRQKLEEDRARRSAGLSVFKSTGNPMADGFRRMIEKKMNEMVQKEMAKSKDQDEVLRIEVERRTTMREKELTAEKERFIKEHEIKLLTAQEAR